MYAIVEIAGHQYKVQKDQQLFVNRLQQTEGAKVAFDNVLLIGDGSKVTVGAPAIEGAQVTAKVVKHLKGDKVIVFKKKRRKGYMKKNGHRQYLTELTIETIVSAGAKKAAAAPKAKPAEAAASDDLKKIEGVGPKTEEILQAAGLGTYKAVAEAGADKIREILEAAGGRYKAHDPSTWSQQAAMAAEGKWDELKAWQDELKGGKE